MVTKKIFCFRCKAEIPKKIKRKKTNDKIKGRCPSCKRIAVFIDSTELKKQDGIDEWIDDTTTPSTPSTTSTTTTTPTTSTRKGYSYLIKGLLEKERKPFKCIGRGVNNGVFYIGTVLDQENKQMDAVVTSERKIYVDWTGNGKDKDSINEIKKEFGLNYRFGLFIDCIDYWWSNKSIDKWYTTDYEVNIKDLYKKIVEINKKYMIYEDEKIHNYTALDIMRSYFFPLFDANSRTYHHADPGSGKTNQLMIYRALSFNPISSTDFSTASIYRTIESTQGTILIDDFDNLPEEQKTATLSHIRKNYKPFKVIRADGNKQNRPYGYNAYSHLIFNNVFGLGYDDVTPERIITIRLLKHKEAKDITVNSNDPIFDLIRDDLYIMTLQYWKEIKESYDTLKVEDLTTRELEVIKPILAIARVIDKKVYNSILKWYNEHLDQEKNTKDLSNDWEFNLLTRLWDIVKDKENNDQKQVFVKEDIAKEIGPLLFNEENKDYKKNINKLCAFIGGKIKGYIKFKGGRSNGRSYYKIYKKGVKQILEARGLLEILEPKNDDEQKVGVVEGVEGRGATTPKINTFNENATQQEKKEEKKPFNDYEQFIPKIEKLLKSKPKTEWKINDICQHLGIASLSARKEITNILEKTVSNPKNKTKIQKADENGLLWRLNNE
jgi:hypothetical protein